MMVLTYQQRIAELARQSPEMCFTSIHHFMDAFWLQEAFQRVRRDGAVGVDEQSWAGYAEHLTANLQDLVERIRTGKYRALPARRAYIPKPGTTEKRPIGVLSIEDKVVQRGVVMLLEPIYEATFHECSHGFRPRRSPHKALDQLWRDLMAKGISCIIEVDIKSYFDEIDHSHLRAFLDRRVKDGVIRRLIDKWLKAGVLEEGVMHYPEAGTQQGGVISPLLANIYLHYVLDEWYEHEVGPRLRGASTLLRYADDFVLGFRHEKDAQRVFDVLPKRFARYGLRLHPTKTRVVRITRPRPKERPQKGRGPGTFTFLGFTHYWGLSRRGHWVIKRKTAPKRFTRSLRKLTGWLRSHRHLKKELQHKGLCTRLRGVYGAWGITGNYRSLSRLRCAVERQWFKWWNRRGGKRLPWERFKRRILERFPLPLPRIVHSAVAKP